MNQRDKQGKLVRPIFHSQVPTDLLHGISRAEKWMYEHQSIQEQQNEWLITQALASDERQRDLEENMDSLIGIKRSSIVSLLTWILIPGGLLALGAWLTHWFEKRP